MAPDKRDYLRGYVAAVVGDLMRRKLVKLTDPLDRIVTKVVAEFAQDVYRDMKAVLEELGREAAAQVVERGLEVGGQLLEDFAAQIVGGIRNTGRKR